MNALRLKNRNIKTWTNASFTPCRKLAMLKLVASAHLRMVQSRSRPMRGQHVPLFRQDRLCNRLSLSSSTF